LAGTCPFRQRGIGASRLPAQEGAQYEENFLSGKPAVPVRLDGMAGSFTLLDSRRVTPYSIRAEMTNWKLLDVLGVKEG